MQGTEIRSAIESLIFASEEPISFKQLLTLFEEAGINKEEVTTCLEALKEDINNNPARGLQIVEIAGGFQFRTKPSNATWIQKLAAPKPVRLSQPALETLAIIAYRQPLIRSEIEEIRGVDAGGVIKTLLERNLICILGRRDEPGQPLIYGTTQAFLELFSLNSLKDLPPLADIEELARKRVETVSQNEFKLAAERLEANFPVPEEKLTENEEEETETLETAESINDAGDEILDSIEDNIKELRKLEKEIFPKAKTDEQETNPPPEVNSPEN
ncbi:MAG: SMC-Scp complex subunit ScpB [Pseudomonadota bacterium]